MRPRPIRPTYLAYATSGDRFVTLLLDPVSAELLGEVPEQSLHPHASGPALRSAGRPQRSSRQWRGRACSARDVRDRSRDLVARGQVTGRASLTVDFSRQWRRVNWDLHSAVGFWAVTLDRDVGRHWRLFHIPRRRFGWPSIASLRSRVSPHCSRSQHSGGRRALHGVRSSTRLSIECRGQAPGARVVLPSSNTSPFLVMFSRCPSRRRPTPQLTSVYLDQYTGEAVVVPPPARPSAGEHRDGVAHAAARRQLRRQRHQSGVVAVWNGTAGALRHRLHHVVDARRACALASWVTAGKP